ncbi:LysE/ArgO family amino acid transporter [Shewanella ulleungensis]|jgi:L-lysine exporter family protein LysE/ArgO|uniref:Amino acid transporter n=1 Tax=Shewanella ulleungensis TaxID=2282699 RepID=A0ABQ2QIB8_9GAMM|nr:LysE/ArgO family amino acid transporter [Shewanella ulleungensis]MCL1151815.1 LysE/ArgO family amino acid transporter [Shewanella ulleungensis]GGP83267.1 amino acid transporter [Shewanella ulleungensis]
MTTSALFQGLILGLGMIIPIGAQNSYILSQGIKRNHHFLAATICMLCDVLLIGLGIFGGGKLIASSEWLMLLIGWGGVSFLVVYAAISFKSVWINQYSVATHITATTSRKKIIGTTFAVTLLNPHVYLDTVMILGSVGGTFDGNEKWAFAIGTMLASILWFYTIAFGAAKLAPWLGTPNVQRLIDSLVGVIMLIVAYSLLTTLI